MTPFTRQALLRILLLAATLGACVLFASIGDYAIAACLLLAAAGEVYALFRFIIHTHEEIVSFLRGINFADFSQNARSGLLGSSHQDVALELERIIENFKQARIEKEESLQYLQTVVEHVEIGLLCFDAEGSVELYNKTAAHMLSMPSVTHLSSVVKKHGQFGTLLLQMTPRTKRTYRLAANGAMQELLITAVEFRMKHRAMKLISLYNIQQELEATEIDAWQKLIKVLTHEIMNSITPISSLASTLDLMLQEASDSHTLGRDTIDDLSAAIRTIHRRSDGLIRFVNNYRDVATSPQPNFRTVNVSELLYQVRLLMERTFQDKRICFSVSVIPETLVVTADPDLLEQVLLNLLHNSVHALEAVSDGRERRIGITARQTEPGRTTMRITDNGNGIPEAIIDKIFIPFFTTKQEGSGVGLSISQRIIRAHGGTMRATSRPGLETELVITL